MNNKQIIKTLVQISGKRSLWDTFSRHVFVLNNFLQNKTLSIVEPKNHQDYKPRIHYLDLLAKGFELEIDYNSPLFENRLLKEAHNFYTDDSLFYRRFFTRLKFFRENNLPINSQTLEQMVMDGNLMFNDQYNFHNKDY